MAIRLTCWNINFSPVAVQVKTSPLSEVKYALLKGENAHVNGISEAIGATASDTIFFFYFEGPNRGPAEASHVDVERALGKTALLLGLRGRTATAATEPSRHLMQSLTMLLHFRK